MQCSFSSLVSPLWSVQSIHKGHKHSGQLSQGEHIYFYFCLTMLHTASHSVIFSVTLLAGGKGIYTSIKRYLSKGLKKTRASFLLFPLFQRLPASIKYACCEEKEVIFILFSQASPRKYEAQNCFPQLLEEREAVFLKSNQHLSIKT